MLSSPLSTRNALRLALPARAERRRQGWRYPSAAPSPGKFELAEEAPRGHGDESSKNQANHAGSGPGLSRNAGLCRRPPQRLRPHQRQRRADVRGPRRRCPCSIPASCSATASGRGCGSSTDASPSSTRTSTACGTARRCCASTSASPATELTARLFESIDANGMTDGVHIRLMVTRGVKRSPYQDPRLTVGARDHRHHSGVEAAAAGNVRARAESFHRPHPPHRAGRAGPEAQLPFEAQLHPRLHPGDGGGRGRGADARRPRLRRNLQFDPFLHRAQGRGVDLGRRLLPRRHHPRRGAARGAARRRSGVREGLLAVRRLRRRRSLHAPGPSPGSRRSSGSTAAPIGEARATPADDAPAR